MTKDLRRYAQQTNVRLFLGFFLLLFIIGDGLIFIFYGKEPAVLGFLCLVTGTAPLVLIAVILWLMELFVKRDHEK